VPKTKIIKELIKRAGEGDGLAMRGINAWHGSPHEFEKFKMSQVGTGEGAQTFGHGLYFAERKGTAESYRDALSVGPGVQDHYGAIDDIQEILTDPDTDMVPDELAIDTILSNAMEFNLPLEELSKHWQRIPEMRKVVEAFDLERVLKQILDDPHALNKANALLNEGRGSLYNVELKASPDELLDWDAPLSEQSIYPVETTKNKAARYKVEGKKPSAKDKLDAVMEANQGQTGGNFYHNLMSKYGGDQAKVSEYLRDAGIKGIKYKDAMSRGAEGGTRNYVMFDEDTIDIIKKYGLGAAAVGIAGTESDEAEAGVRGKLAKDLASRMKRAAEGGFMTKMPLFHGTASNIEKFDLSKGGDVSGSLVGRLGVSLALEPSVANEFASLAGDQGSNVMKVFHKAEKPASLRLTGDETNLEIAGTVQDAWDQGFDAIKFDNYTTPSGEKGKSFILVKDPSQIRSTQATFDPAKKTSANLLASGAPVAAGLGAATSLTSPESQANYQAAVKELQRRGLGHLIPTTDTIKAAKYPKLQEAADVLRGVATPIGAPYEATADILQAWAYGEHPDKLDYVLSPMEVTDPSMWPSLGARIADYYANE